MYENAKSHVSINNNLSEAFPCQVGVRQGENLSPLLFAMYLNDFESFLSERYDGLTKVSSSILNELNIYFRIFCLLYADDTLVLAESATQLQKALDGLHEYCNIVVTQSQYRQNQNSHLLERKNSEIQIL